MCLQPLNIFIQEIFNYLHILLLYDYVFQNVYKKIIFTLLLSIEIPQYLPVLGRSRFDSKKITSACNNVTFLFKYEKHE